MLSVILTIVILQVSAGGFGTLPPLSEVGPSGYNKTGYLMEVASDHIVVDEETVYLDKDFKLVGRNEEAVPLSWLKAPACVDLRLVVKGKKVYAKKVRIETYTNEKGNEIEYPKPPPVPEKAETGTIKNTEPTAKDVMLPAKRNSKKKTQTHKFE